MRRRAPSFQPALTLPSASKSKSAAASSSSPSPPQWSSLNSHTLVLLLSVAIFLWIFLCFHIHIQLSVEPTPLGARLRRRFSAPDAPSTKREGLAACLLVNDENPRLPEWIAYHYQVLPLRSLIVAVDPASRSSPTDVLGRWEALAGLEVQVWEEKRYMPYGGDGACDGSDPRKDCLKQHRKRQQHFVRACMAEFQRHNNTWVLLTDVDEYITFNTYHPDRDAAVPLDFAPPGVPMLSNWTWHVTGFVNSEGERVDDTHLKGILAGLPPEGWHGVKNGRPKTTLPLTSNRDDIFYGAYGSAFTDTAGNKWFLRDDFAWRDAWEMTPEQVPKDVLIIQNSSIEGNLLRGMARGHPVEIRTNWRELTDLQSRGLLVPTSLREIKTIHGGHMMKDVNGKQFYVERDTMLWPPHLSTLQLMGIRKRLPTVASGATVLDVINNEMRALGAEYANETIGPCLCMPRLLYGSREEADNPTWKSMAPGGFEDGDFVTLRFRWHSLPDNRVNKYQKTIIDVSRIPKKGLKGEAENIHTPVKHFCREKQPPRYATSFFRVNHYLDSFEAYSYRNDARADKRQCRECYDKKGEEATKEIDDDIRPWLKAFVDSVGTEKARMLLAGAGNFVHLS